MFLGPIAVSALAFPFVRLSDALGAVKFTSQYIGKSAVEILNGIGRATCSRISITQ